MLFKNENLTELSSKREGGLRSSEVASTRAPAPAPRVFLVVQVVVQYFTSQCSPVPSTQYPVPSTQHFTSQCSPSSTQYPVVLYPVPVPSTPPHSAAQYPASTQYITSQFSPELSPPRLSTAVDPTHRLLSRHAVMPLNQLWLHTEGIGDNYDEAVGDVGENRGLGHDDYNARITLPVFIHIYGCGLSS